MERYFACATPAKPSGNMLAHKSIFASLSLFHEGKKTANPHFNPYFQVASKVKSYFIQNQGGCCEKF
jgi:hypothetical protein